MTTPASLCLNRFRIWAGMDQHKLDLWRRQRAKRRAKTLAAELRRKPMNIRPGGNDQTQFPRTVRALIVPCEEPVIVAHRPILKHVPPNTHQAGSIAWAFFYRYIRHGE